MKPQTVYHALYHRPENSYRKAHDEMHQSQSSMPMPTPALKGFPTVSKSDKMMIHTPPTPYNTTALSPALFPGEALSGGPKRVLTISQLRKAACIHASVHSPLQQHLAIASPIAARIRHDILFSTTTTPPPPPPSVNTATPPPKSLIESKPTVERTSRPLSQTTPLNESRRKRLHETRFRGHTPLPTSANVVPVPTPTQARTLGVEDALNNTSPVNQIKSTSKTTRTLLFVSPPPLQPQQDPSTIPIDTKSKASASRTLLSPLPTPTSCKTCRMPLKSLLAIENQSPLHHTCQSTPRSAMSSSSLSLSSSFSFPSLTPTTPQPQSNATRSDAFHDTKHVDSDTSMLLRNLDKRTARLLHANRFMATIATLSGQQHPPTPSHPPLSDTKTGRQPTMRNSHSNVSVVIRKRPLFPSDVARGDFDVVRMPQQQQQQRTHANANTTPPQALRSVSTTIVYKTSLKADMKTIVVEPISFPCTAALDEHASQSLVYATAVAPMLAPLIPSSIDVSTSTTFTPPLSGTVLLFGQTGSGKTFTMTGLEKDISKNLIYPVHVQALEISGKNVRDLFATNQLPIESGESSHSLSASSISSPQRKQHQLRIVDHGHSSVIGGAWISAVNGNELLRLLSVAKSYRTTRATDRNSESSRSHAVVTIRLDSAEGKMSRCLTLVDCAGTERSHDSLYHSKDRRVESAEINASLYALKECIRARAAAMISSSLSPKLIPYRSSTLTRVLRPHLENGGPLTVIATVAPNATDTEHSLQTLETVLTLLGESGQVGKKVSIAPVDQPISLSQISSPLVPPKRWTRDQLIDFLKSKRFLPSSPGTTPVTSSKDYCGNNANTENRRMIVPITMDGRQVMRMNKLQLANAFHTSRETSGILFDLLRAETTRVARFELKRRVNHRSVGK